MTIADAVVARVQAALPDDVVLDGIVLDEPPVGGHVAVYCSDGSLNRPAISGPADDATIELTVHSFGPTAEAARWLSGRVVDDLMSAPIVATGWNSFWFTEHHRRPVDPDTDVPGRPTVMVVDQLTGQTTKSA